MLLHRSREHTYHKMRTDAVKIKIKRLLNKKEGSESHETTRGAKESKEKRSVLNLFSGLFTQAVQNEKKKATILPLTDVAKLFPQVNNAITSYFIF